MPKTLTLRNVPDRVVAALRKRARIRRRSMQAELLAIVEQAVVDRRSLEEQLSQLRHGVDAGLTLAEIDAAVEEGRP